jgi:lipoprotein-anchoring transpeptidase ErfK/SrfK
MRKIIGVTAALAAVAMLQGYAAARQSATAAAPAAPAVIAPTVSVPLPQVELAKAAVTSPTVAVASPAPSAVNPDPSNPTGDLLEVSKTDQRLTVWRDGVVVSRLKISTGRKGYETPSGHFKVHTKYRNRWSRTWKVWMPYAMFWHPTEGYAFHELPYYPGHENKRIGASKLGRADSHGCIRVNLGDAKTLYEFTRVGTPVWIH